MLQYTVENVSKYWDDSNYRIFTFKMNNNQVLVVTSSNETNSKLYNWSDNYIGKTLYEIMEKEHADRWHIRFADWKKNGGVSYIAYFNDQSIAWETTIEIHNDTIFGNWEKNRRTKKLIISYLVSMNFLTIIMFNKIAIFSLA